VPLRLEQEKGSGVSQRLRVATQAYPKVKAQSVG